MTYSQTYQIPAGDRGIMKTVEKMRQLVDQDLKNPLPVEVAGAIHSSSCCPAERAQAIRDFLTEAVVFTPDPLGHELLKAPSYMLELIREQGYVTGDCDDVAILGATLGMAIGLPARFVLLGFDPTQPYSHVYTELLTPEGWAELDTTAPAQMPDGLQIHREKRIDV